MRRAMRVIPMLIVCVASAHAFAQTGQPTGQQTLAATMNVYVFPKQGQKAERQSMDEAACYQWAVQNTSSDPFSLVKQKEQQKQQADQQMQQAQQTGAGEGAAGAVRGAAVGALIGEIASDDPGKGAAYGAAAGIIGGRRRAAAARSQATQSVEKQAEAAERATEEQIQNFKKAFSVCLEAKEYMVKY